MSLKQAKSYVVGSLDGTQIRTTRDTNDYQSYTLKQKIFSRPDTYIGSVISEEREEFLFDFVGDKLFKSTISVPEGVCRIFLEIISNSGDNVDSSRRIGVEPGKIYVTCDTKIVSVYNEGEPIPLKPLDNSPKNAPSYVPASIFGKLLTSSNYDNNIVRMGAGRNGLGAKAANIFSKWMSVRIGDAKNGQVWEGMWTNGMENLQECITPGHVWDPTPRQGNPQGMWVVNGDPYTGPNFVEVKYKLNFGRFGLEEYPPEIPYMFARYTVDFGFTCKIPVIFNGKEYNIQNIRDYASLYWSEEQIESSILHYEWKNGEEPESFKSLSRAKKKALMDNPKSVDQIPIVEVLCIDSGDSDTLSFVNGLMTASGGVHVNAAFSNVSDMFLPIINKMYTDKSGNLLTKLTIKDVKNNLAMIVNCRLPNSKYRSQSKHYLSSPKPKINISEKELNPLKNWGLIGRLRAAAESRIMKTLKKGQKRKKGRVIRDKGIDANWAGSKKASECTLYIVEGESASSYPKKRIDMLPGGKDVGGYYPLKGKFMNISKKNEIEIANNKEIQDLTQMMGLTEGFTYRNQKELDTLRYGTFMITTDMDSDGTHIRMLLVNFANKYPGLIENGRVRYLRTYAVRLFKGLGKKAVCMGRFSTNEEYEAWEKVNSNHKLNVKYYKGLGTSRDIDIIDDLTTAPTIVFYYDEKALADIDMAFGKDKAAARKEWIKLQRDIERTDNIIADPKNNLLGYRGISNTINTDLVDYTIDSLFRAIPSYLDCLKKVQRQTLEFFLYKWGYGSKPKKSMKVNNIGAACGQRCHYHHGPVAMMDTIVRMVWDFVGSNNLSYYVAEGQLGTRDAGGADAASPRYAETLPEDWIYQVIHKDMVALVPRRIVEGEEGEPEWIPMDIPVGIVNGFNGMATGHSTYCPSHNLYDVIEHIHDLCSGRQPKPLLPYFKGFKGKVEILTKNKKKPKLFISEVDEEPEEDNSDLQKPIIDEDTEKESVIIDDNTPISDTTAPRSVVTFGTFEITRVYDDKSADITITELPVGHWMKNYHKWLCKLQNEGMITSFTDNCTTNTVLYKIVKFKSDRGINHRSLRLRSSFGMNNITLIDNNGYPRVYTTVGDVITDYFQNMYQLYVTYKQSRITSIQEKIGDNEWKIYFISLVVEDKVKVFKQSDTFIYEQMDNYKVPHKYYDQVKLRDCSIEKINKLQSEIDSLKADKAELESKSPEGMWAENLVKIKAYFVKNKYDPEWLATEGKRTLEQQKMDALGVPR